MKRYSDFQKSVSVLLSFIIIINSGCYSIKGISKREIQYANKTEYIIHGPESSYRLAAVTISEGMLQGIVNYTPKTAPKTKTIHIYVAPDSAIKVKQSMAYIPFANIVKAEVNQLDGGKTILATIGAGAAAFFTIGLIAILTKGASCPFIYSNSGDEYLFSGEIFSGATAIPLERDDYLPLYQLKAVDNEYNLKITNEVDEIQNTNMVELLVFDHDPEVEVLLDRYGNPITISDPVQPCVAVDTYGESILDKITKKDDLRYISSIRPDQLCFDTISLAFNRPSDAGSSKLIIKGKNTMWLDYMFGQFADLFGNRYDKWKEKRNTKPAEELLNWSLQQGFQLSAYLDTEDGLKFIDYYNIPGPMGDKEDIIVIDLAGIQSDKIKIKLISGMLFWDIDYIGMDFTSDKNISKSNIPLTSATDEKGNDVTHLLVADDNEYLVQPAPVNETILNFSANEVTTGLERSVFLHSKGHYEILRHAKGKPDIEYLNSFLEPGAFPRFSKEHYLIYYSGR